MMQLLVDRVEGLDSKQLRVASAGVFGRSGWAFRVLFMATADLTVISLGRADASASEYIAEIQRRLAAQDRVRYVLHAMGTSLEGETADILALVGELHAVPFGMGIPRVYTVLKLDERRDKAQTLEDKVKSVERVLAEETP
jgi:uncharacterized protein (TIGR00106 family)